jgi:NADH-ubiquinone oxidoreductase chain 5
MLVLITANNFLQMFVGWEGVGLSSYLLINFWFTRIQANKAAIKAMLVNRVGDFFMLIALFILYFTFNSLDYDIIFSLTPLVVNYKILILNTEMNLLDMICIFLLLGAMGKSAQIGLHTWLPDAMEGPTPVSALIHAATMVTAGVFLIVRCSYLFEFSPFTLNIILIIGSFTAFFASTVGLFQNDIKKVIAYSTCSQLGYMIFACGLSSYEVSIFHLSNHAFFKALLFLSAGSIIHAISDEQDMRKMGGLKNILPFSYSIMVIGSLALIGFPFLTGFYSKDTILELAYSKYNFLGHLSYFLGTFAAFCTAFYSTRLIFLVFLSIPNGNKQNILNAHEGSLRMVLPLFILCLLSIFIGFLTKDLFIGFGTSFWQSSIFILPANYLMVDIEFLSLFYKLLPLIVTIISICVVYFIYTFTISEFFSFKNTILFKKIYTFLNKKWYFDRLYNQYIGQFVISKSYFYTYKDIDRGIIENFGPLGFVAGIKRFSVFIKPLQSGFIYHYLYLFFASFFLILFFLINTSNFLLSFNIMFFLFINYLLF